METLTGFDKTFKYFKRRCPPPDLSLAVDLQDPNTWSQHGVERMEICNTDTKRLQEFGIVDLMALKLLKLHNRPGLLFIPNPFTPEGQQKLVLCCLSKYTQSPPYKLNLEVHPEWGKENLSWWELCCRDESNMWKKKLRWSTLGYHHDWDTKVYLEENQSAFPAELARLSSLLVEMAGFNNFNAEAAIVNFYHMNSTLSGHTDHSEQDHSAPLLSISFGQSAIFLIGGQEKKDKPVALLVKSGDVIIMSGESRLSYHGVPRIVPADSSEAWGNDKSNSEESWPTCHRYLCTSRINVNIRQVLKLGNKTFTR